MSDILELSETKGDKLVFVATMGLNEQPNSGPADLLTGISCSWFSNATLTFWYNGSLDTGLVTTSKEQIL